MFGIVKNKAALAAPADRRRFSFSDPSTWFQSVRGSNPGGLYQKSDYGVWAETVNPLRGLTSQRAQDIFDRARRGVYAELAYIYQEIEAADPTLFICTERREASTGAADWRVVTCNPDRTTGFDETLADEQQDFLSRAYGMAGDEISALAEHLERGFFRGFAHARPVYESGGVVGFETYDQWNFARDPATGEWWWNPDASNVANGSFAQIPAGELVTVERSRHIDYPALAVFIRAALGEKKWGIFIERYGIPPVTVIMPEFADKSEEAAYMEAAQKLARAGSGALPFGSQVSYATEARGANPFTDFLRHQQELVVMMATGGILTTLAAPDSGSLAGGAHETTWRSVVSRDIRTTGRALNRSVTRRLLAERFPGRPMLAMFEFTAEPKPTPTAVFDDAAKAKTAGYLVAQDDLEKRTGYKLVPDPQNAVSTPFVPSVPPAPVANKADAVAKPLQIASDAPEAPAPGKETLERTPPANALKTAKDAKSADPVEAALKALESGATPEEALDAFDAAAKAALKPDTVAATAERIAAQLDAAAAAGKEGK
jgi:phage gp29-like protein